MSSSVGFQAPEASGEIRRAPVHVGLLKRVIDFLRVAFVAVIFLLFSGCALR